MRVCPKCNLGLPDHGVAECPHCQATLSPTRMTVLPEDPRNRTINASMFADRSPQSMDPDPAPPYSAENRSTLVADVVGGFAPPPAPTADAHETLVADQGLLRDAADPAGDPTHSQSDTTPSHSDRTIQADSDELDSMASRLASATPERPSPSQAQTQSTAVIPADVLGTDFGGKSTGGSRGTGSGSGSANEGSRDRRLRQQWNDLAGSSPNPMQSLKSDQSFDGEVLPLISQRRLATEPDDPLADYEIIRPVGKGAMGEVFAARQRSLNRVIALKTISPQRSGNPKDQRKFLYEAQITGELDHPNIVPVHELAVRDDGSPFYSMKLVSGTPWQKVIDQKSRDENLDILLKVADAIAYAHSHDIMHRDLKPENVMLGRFGEVLVMDWGLAVDLRRGHKFELAGTPAYMSPEMARHDVAKIGPPSDIYLLGAILFQIVAGYPPHPGRTVSECVMAAAKNQFQPVKDAHDPLLKIAARAMAAEPTDRYVTVGEFQQAIRDYRRHAESVAQSQRAEETLQQAIAGDDYEAFSRAMFGFTSAAELWPENAVATQGIDRARLAYGTSALNRSDFDLALQVLRPDAPEEAALYEQAKAGKAQAQQRVQRIRALRNTLAVGGLAASVVFMILTAVAMNRADVARAAQSDAEIAHANADIARLSAEDAAFDAKLASIDAMCQHSSAEADRRRADHQRNLALQAKNEEEIARADAEKAHKKAEGERRRAELLRVQAERNLLVAEVRNYPALLALAATQVRQQDVDKSVEVLKDIVQLQSRLAERPRAPRLVNWAFDRVRLSTNRPIATPSDSEGSASAIPAFQATDAAGNHVRLSAANVSPASPLVALGTESGRVLVVRWNGRQFESVSELETVDGAGENAPIRHIAIHPSGKWIAYTQPTEAHHSLYWWRVGDAAAERLPVEGLEITSLQFSRTGDALVAVPSKGLRAWRVNDGGLVSKEPAAMGTNQRFTQLCWVESAPAGEALALSVQGNRAYLGRIDVTEPGDKLSLIDPVGEPLSPQSTLTHVAADEFLVGDDSGTIRAMAVRGNQYQLDAPLRATRHATGVRQMVAQRGDSASPGMRMLSVGLEPVINVWRRESADKGASDASSPSGLARGIWEPATQLVGHGSGSILAVQFLASNQSAVSVDASGLCLFWDLRRQLERDVLARPTRPAEIVYTGGAGIDGTMRTIDAHGVTETWNGLDGERTGHWLYVGHTPGARVHQMVASANGRVLLTSAILDGTSSVYLSDSDSTGARREFCAWELPSGRMIRRWTDDFGGNPCVALSPSGRYAYCGTDSDRPATAAIDLQTGDRIPLTVHSEGLNQTIGLGADVLTIRPGATPMITAIARGGAVSLVPAEQPAETGVRNIQLQEPPADATNPRAVDAMWNTQGNRLYLVFNTGHLRVIAVTDGAGGRLDVRLLRESRLETTLPEKGQFSWTIDSSPADRDVLRIVTRGRHPQAIRIEINRETGAVLDQSIEPAEQDWITASGDTRYAANLSSVASEIGFTSVTDMLAIGTERWVARSSDGAIALVAPATRRALMRFGRTACHAADGNATGSTLVTAHAEGQLYVAHLASNESPKWTPVAHPFDRIVRAELAPNGRYLAVLGETTGEDSHRATWCLDLGTLQPIDRCAVAGAVDVRWRPGTDDGTAELAILVPGNPSGAATCRRFRVIGGDGAGETQAEPLADVQVTLDEETAVADVPVRVAYFQEQFASDDDAPYWYLAVLYHSAETVGSVVALRACDPDVLATSESDSSAEGVAGSETSTEGTADDEDGDQAQALGSVNIVMRSARITRLAGSGANNLLAMGDEAGTASIWFAAPSVDRTPYELITLDDHRGARISHIGFSADGKILTTGDAAGRHNAWLSQDPLHGLAEGGDAVRVAERAAGQGASGAVMPVGSSASP